LVSLEAVAVVVVAEATIAVGCPDFD